VISPLFSMSMGLCASSVLVTMPVVALIGPALTTVMLLPAAEV
jgi:hypothetical protein